MNSELRQHRFRRLLVVPAGIIVSIAEKWSATHKSLFICLVIGSYPTDHDKGRIIKTAIETLVTLTIFACFFVFTSPVFNCQFQTLYFLSNHLI